MAVMGTDPSEAGAHSDCPVEGVSWVLAQEYCQKASTLVGRHVRLPSEAEWEYACRAGTTSDFHFGMWGPYADDNELPLDIHPTLSRYAWYDMNSRGRTQPVRLLRPNPWGLHDMIGNVWEWCEDVWHDDYTDAPLDSEPWCDGEALQDRRCLRGGAWDMNAFRCRSSYRSYEHRALGTSRIGFRVVLA